MYRSNKLIQDFALPYSIFKLVWQTRQTLLQLSFLNACTLVPTVFRWHKKMAFKFHFYFSFFFDLVKWNSIPIPIFRFLSTCDIKKRIWISFSPHFEKGIWISVFFFSFSHLFEKRIWISYFVFRFRITLKNGFEFRFSYLHWLLLKNRLEFRFSFLHEFEKWINTPVIWNFPPPPHLRGWPG